MSGGFESLDDHRRIEDEDVVERYVTGRLSEDERASFEEHLVACPECAQQAHWAEELRQGLRRVAAEGAARPTAAGRWRRPSTGLAAAAGLAAGLLVAVVLRPGPAGPDPAGDARYEDERRRADNAEAARRELEQAVARQAEEGRRLREELARSQPPAQVPTFLLNAVRSGEGAAAANRVRPGDAAWLVLSVEVDPDAGFREYRGSIVTLAGGGSVWAGDGLNPGSAPILSLLLRADLLPPGDYLLVLEGLAPGGRAAPAGRYPFRVDARP